MNIIKRTGNTFTIDANPETLKWLEEVARVANTDEATALNSVLTQAWGGWAAYKRRAYELELEAVQAVKPEGEAKETSEAKTTYVDLDAKPEDTSAEWTDPKSPEEALINLLYGISDTMFPKKDRAKVAAVFKDLKNRIKTKPTADEIAKAAMDRAMKNEDAPKQKCACGNPECGNEFTPEQHAAISKIFEEGRVGELLLTFLKKNNG